jgi:hypothetical protein
VLLAPLGPDGELLRGGRRLTRRAARPWVARPDVPLGHRPPCAPVTWVLEGDRETAAAAWRARRGGDRHRAGDAVLHRLLDGRRVLVLEEGW